VITSTSVTNPMSVSTSVDTLAPTTSVATPTTPGDERAAFLAALSAAGVPVSASGESEILIAQGLCKELASGTPRASLVDDLARMGGVMTPQTAEATVTAAEQTYC
jgi:hypothetical protein